MKYVAIVMKENENEENGGFTFVPLNSKTIGNLFRESEALLDGDGVKCVAIASCNGEKVEGMEVYREEVVAWGNSEWRAFDGNGMVVVRRGKEYVFMLDIAGA